MPKLETMEVVVRDILEQTINLETWCVASHNGRQEDSTATPKHYRLKWNFLCDICVVVMVMAEGRVSNLKTSYFSLLLVSNLSTPTAIVAHV